MAGVVPARQSCSPSRDVIVWARYLVLWLATGPLCSDLIAETEQAGPRKSPEVWLLHSWIRASLLVLGSGGEAGGHWHDAGGGLYLRCR